LIEESGKILGSGIKGDSIIDPAELAGLGAEGKLTFHEIYWFKKSIRSIGY
jgi:hypothetical protein